jgi:hypothetical protein
MAHEPEDHGLGEKPPAAVLDGERDRLPDDGGLAAQS